MHYLEIYYATLSTCLDANKAMVVVVKHFETETPCVVLLTFYELCNKTENHKLTKLATTSDACN